MVLLLLLLMLVIGRVRGHTTEMALPRARMVMAATVPRAIAVHYSCHAGALYYFFFFC